MTNVKRYKDEQILDRVLQIGGKFPDKGKLLFVAIQSEENAINRFDDKVYVYVGRGENKKPNFIMVSSCTTNTGKTGLINFKRYNPHGVFVWKLDEYYEDCFQAGYHKPSRADGGMKAWRLIRDVKYYRDGDMDLIPEQTGRMFEGNKATNMHGVSYNRFSNIIRKFINGWSLGCIVWNNMIDYHYIIKLLWHRGKKADFAILKEF